MVCSDKCCTLEGCNKSYFMYFCMAYSILLETYCHYMQLHPHIHKHFYISLAVCMSMKPAWADQFCNMAFSCKQMFLWLCLGALNIEIFEVLKCLTITFTWTVCPCSVYSIKWLQVAVDSLQKEKEILSR